MENGSAGVPPARKLNENGKWISARPEKARINYEQQHSDSKNYRAHDFKRLNIGSWLPGNRPLSFTLLGH